MTHMVLKWVPPYFRNVALHATILKLRFVGVDCKLQHIQQMHYMQLVAILPTVYSAVRLIVCNFQFKWTTSWRVVSWIGGWWFINHMWLIKWCHGRGCVNVTFLQSYFKGFLMKNIKLKWLDAQKREIILTAVFCLLHALCIGNMPLNHKWYPGQANSMSQSPAPVSTLIWSQTSPSAESDRRQRILHCGGWGIITKLGTADWKFW